MKPTKITERTYELTVNESPDATVNMALIRGKLHNFLIDTGVGANSPLPLLEIIKDCQKPLIVINTHGDWDHVYGNCAFENGVIVAHSLARKKIDEGWEDAAKWVLEKGCITDGEVRKVLPNVTFEDVMHFPEDGLTLFHTPFHTECCVSIYDRVDKILHIGDNFGFEDGKAYPWGKEVDAFHKVVNAYKQYDFGTCLSGHSKPQTHGVIEMLENSLEPWQEYWRKNSEAN
ncbi:MAG: MBL fold metallo-hydrolase [Defluviitaleaceae bacterium]|nr:MBL fold metallo-hydrolase [Defluviitaleaceae bacterium]